MNKILIVDDNKADRENLKNILKTFSRVEVNEAIDSQSAIDLVGKQYFNLVLMNSDMPGINGVEVTKSIKSFNDEVMIIAFSTLQDTASEKDIILAGAKDYITKPVEEKLLVQRLKNYLEIIDMKKWFLFNRDIVNLFDKNVHPRTMKFNVNSDASLEAFLNYCFHYFQVKDVSELCGCIGVMYGLGRWLIKQQHFFSIIIEENDSHFYFTQMPVDFIAKQVVEHIIEKHDHNAEYIMDSGRLSFKIKTEAMKISSEAVEQIDEEIISDKEMTEEERYQKQILGKTHFNKVDAREYVENTAISLMSKIDDLANVEDRLDAAIINLENNPNSENIATVSSLFMEYIDVIELLVEFEHLAYGLKTLHKFLTTLKKEQFSEKNLKKFITLMLSLLSDLESWKDNIFIKLEANDIHYLDSSLLSSCLQIEAIFDEEKKIEEEEDDFELF